MLIYIDHWTAKDDGSDILGFLRVASNRLHSRWPYLFLGCTSTFLTSKTRIDIIEITTLLLDKFIKVKLVPAVTRLAVQIKTVLVSLAVGEGGNTDGAN